MKNLSIHNAIDKYQPTPSLYYDIEGKITDNDGKNIKIEKNINSKVIEYDVKLKNEIDVVLGDNIRIDKENIQSLKVNTKDSLEQKDNEEIGKIIKNLNLENSEEYQEIIKNLINMGIRPTKENINSYKESKNSLNSIITKIDTQSIIKMLDSGIDFENYNLLDVSQAIDSIKDKETELSIKKFLNLDKEMDYDSAEKISQKIFNQKMGKDVYDIIISLDKEGIEINRINIEKALDIINKIHNLKYIEDNDYTVILKEDLDFSINNLFKVKNNYTVSPINVNNHSDKFEETTIIDDISLDNLIKLLDSLEIETNDDNISIGREFILNNVPLTKDSFYQIIDMKNNVNELRKELTKNKVIKLLNNDVDILEENIEDLLNVINMDIYNLELDINDSKNDISSVDDKLENLDDLKFIGEIKDGDLLKLIKSGKDFNLNNLKQVNTTDIKDDLGLDFKVLDKSKILVNMFNKIGDIPDIKTISLSVNSNSILKNNIPEVSLDDLFENTIEVEKNNPNIETVETEIEDVIVNEYIKARKNISTTLVRESIIEHVDLTKMPLNNLNNYLENKINKYKEIHEINNNINNIKLNSEKIIPIIMKNNLSMTLKEINNINSYFLGESGLVKAINNKKTNLKYREELASLQKDISNSLKEDFPNIKKSYSNLLNSLEYSSEDFINKDDQNESKSDEYIDFQNKISKNDTIFQLPVEIDGNFKDLNIIVPNTNKGIDKNNMKFALSIDTKNLGYIDFKLNVIDKEIFINIDKEDNRLINNIGILKKSLNEIGYNLNLMENKNDV